MGLTVWLKTGNYNLVLISYSIEWEVVKTGNDITNKCLIRNRDKFFVAICNSVPYIVLILLLRFFIGFRLQQSLSNNHTQKPNHHLHKEMHFDNNNLVV